MEFVIGALSGCSAVLFSNPFEVVKTRMQLQGELQKRGSHVVHYTGPFNAAVVIARADGITALQKGLAPALCYQCITSSIRLGVYQYMDNEGFLRDQRGQVDVVTSVLVGSFGGALGSFLASPFSMLKTQMQATSHRKIAVGEQHKHKSTADALANIARQHGIRGLYRGSRVIAIRIGFGSGVQLTTFSKAKEFLSRQELVPSSRPVLLAFSASLVSGLVLALLASPLDIVLTRLYNQKVDTNGWGLKYKSILDCVVKIFHTEGFRGFYKGVVPLYFKSAPHVTLILVFWERYKALFDTFLPKAQI